MIKKVDAYVKQSIEARKNAFSASFEVSAEMQKKINDLFVEIEKFGEKCKDVGEFEAEFVKSPLNQQYMDLFTEVATGSVAKMTASGVSDSGVSVSKTSKGGIGKMVAGGVAAGIAESAAEQSLNEVVPTRAAVHQKAYDEVRKVPVLGDAIDIGQKASYAAHLGGLFSRRKKKEK